MKIARFLQKQPAYFHTLSLTLLYPLIASINTLSDAVIAMFIVIILVLFLVFVIELLPSLLFSLSISLPLS